MDKTIWGRGIIIVSILLLSGCATTGSRHTEMETQKLRTQLGTMEQQLKQSEKEIEDLEWQLEKEKQMRRGCEKQLGLKKTQLQNTGRKTPQASIRKIQTALRKAGFYKGAVDGKLGPQTKEAIRAFQKSNGLKADGIVGKATWQVLARYLSEAPGTK